MNIYQLVTDRIIAQMNKGIIPWQKPWGSISNWAINYESRKEYSLINQILLEEPGEYLTWKQIQVHKGTVKKGAKSRLVVFFSFVPNKKRLTELENNASAEGRSLTEYERTACTYPVLKYHSVFHIKDVEGIESKIKDESPVEEKVTPIDAAERVIDAYLERETTLGFQNNKLSNRAFYSRTFDKVVVPMLSQYKIPEEYYSTVFHEFIHSTILSSRCDRVSETSKAYFGNYDYSREELVAEIGAAMLCNRCGIDCEEVFNNSIAYLQSWAEAMRADSKMIIWASSRAEKVAKYILNE